MLCYCCTDEIPIEIRNPGTSWKMSIFLVVNAALGAGLLNFPAAYSLSGGLVIAISLQAVSIFTQFSSDNINFHFMFVQVLVFFIMGSLLMLAFCSDVSGSSTYQDVVQHLCGKRAQILTSIAVVLYCFGTCVTFLIIIADQWDKCK